MEPTLIILIVAAIGAGAVAVVSILQRRDLLRRATVSQSPLSPSILRPDKKAAEAWLEEYLGGVGATRADHATVRAKLIQAGMESSAAVGIYNVLRVASLATFPIIAWFVAPFDRPVLSIIMLATAFYLGYILPIAMLERLVRQRQERIRRAVPDTLDLLVVCVEAGISLDSAILRVARDTRILYPDLAFELTVANRVTNAGIPRDEALRGLWERTGVLEIRSLVTALVQSEKWGTSIGTVLRVQSDSLRRQRRQRAEKRAKTAPLKMTFPLLFFILPALFAVTLGPAVVHIIREFGKFSR
jgi:tight adherence protein C